jgi:hypothetical protein
MWVREYYWRRARRGAQMEGPRCSIAIGERVDTNTGSQCDKNCECEPERAHPLALGFTTGYLMECRDRPNTNRSGFRRFRADGQRYGAALHVHPFLVGLAATQVCS